VHPNSGVRPADTHRAHPCPRVTRSIREKATREHEPAYTRTAKGQDGRTEEGTTSTSLRQGPEPTDRQVRFGGVTTFHLCCLVGGTRKGRKERRENFIYLEPGRHVAPVSRGEYDCVELLLPAVREPDPTPGYLLHCSHYLGTLFQIKTPVVFTTWSQSQRREVLFSTGGKVILAEP
jgi:hypothetical protein